LAAALASSASSMVWPVVAAATAAAGRRPDGAILAHDTGHWPAGWPGRRSGCARSHQPAGRPPSRNWWPAARLASTIFPLARKWPQSRSSRPARSPTTTTHTHTHAHGPARHCFRRPSSRVSRQMSAVAAATRPRRQMTPTAGRARRAALHTRRRQPADRCRSPAIGPLSAGATTSGVEIAISGGEIEVGGRR
jgi:hypothetical protein